MITVWGTGTGAPVPADVLAGARLVAGARRHLAAAPLPSDAERVELGPLEPALARIARCVEDGGRAVVLASGDPGFFGIVRVLAERFGSARLDVRAGVSSVAAAFARAGLPWEDAVVVSAHGRELRTAVNVCRARPKVAVLTGPGAGPADLGAALRGTPRTLLVASALGSAEERVERVTPEEAAARDWGPAVNVVLCLDPARALGPVRTFSGAGAGPARWALAEGEFAHRDAMITKFEVRALALARLGPRLGDLVWDVGAGSGAVAVECARLGAAVVAVERTADGAERVRANARAHGVDVRVVHGEAPGALDRLDDPDAVFVGGGGRALPEVVTACAARARRTVVVALAALDRVPTVRSALTDAGFTCDGVLLQSSRLTPLPGDVTRLAAGNPVFLLWGQRKEEVGSEASASGAVSSGTESGSEASASGAASSGTESGSDSEVSSAAAAASGAEAPSAGAPDTQAAPDAEVSSTGAATRPEVSPEVFSEVFSEVSSEVSSGTGAVLSAGDASGSAAPAAEAARGTRGSSDTAPDADAAPDTGPSPAAVAGAGGRAVRVGTAAPAVPGPADTTGVRDVSDGPRAPGGPAGTRSSDAPANAGLAASPAGTVAPVARTGVGGAAAPVGTAVPDTARRAGRPPCPPHGDALPSARALPRRSREVIGLIAATRAGAAARDRLAAAWPERTRVFDGPVKEAVRAAFAECGQLVCFLATGAAVRLLAPLLGEKETDPGVVCVDEAGRFAVALLGGHAGGANALAHEVAGVLGASPVVTTATDAVDLPGLDTLGLPVEGDVAGVTRALLDGEPVALRVETPWPLPALPLTGDEAPRVVRVTDRAVEPGPGEAVLRPPSLVVGVGASRGVSAGEVLGLVRGALAEAGLSERSVAELATVDAKAEEPGLLAAAGELGVPLVTCAAEELASVPVPNPSAAPLAAVGTPSVAEAAALRHGGELLVPKRKSVRQDGGPARATCAVARRPARGRLALVGLGPGARDLLTPRAREELRRASVVVGLDQYVAQIRDLLRPGTRVLESGLGAEEERARTAVAEARAGRAVALIGSGDAGVYAMASPALAEAGDDIDVVGVPGVTAALAAAAVLGAPLGHDHVAISLSDLHTPWEVIERRVRAAAEADLVVSFYNPRSRGRDRQLPRALALLAGHRPPGTPVGVVRNASRPGESRLVTTLDALDPTVVDMLSVVVVGNSATRVVAGRMVTPRGYRWQETPGNGRDARGRRGEGAASRRAAGEPGRRPAGTERTGPSGPRTETAEAGQDSAPSGRRAARPGQEAAEPPRATAAFGQRADGTDRTPAEPRRRTAESGPHVVGPGRGTVEPRRAAAESGSPTPSGREPVECRPEGAGCGPTPAAPVRGTAGTAREVAG